MDTCVCCGAYVPEGRWVCPDCEKTDYTDPEWGFGKEKKEPIIDLIYYPNLVDFFKKHHENAGCILVDSNLEGFGDCRLECFDCLINAIKQDMDDKSA